MHFVADNPLWGAPRIHGELLKLGFEIADVFTPNATAILAHARKGPDEELTESMKKTSPTIP